MTNKRYRWCVATKSYGVGFKDAECATPNRISKRKRPLDDTFVFSDAEIDWWIELLQRHKSGGDLANAGYAIAYIDAGFMKEVRDGRK